MAKAILLSSDSILSNVVIVNLRAYVDLQVDWVQDIEEFKKLLDPTHLVILSSPQFAIECRDYCEEKRITSKRLCLGASDKTIAGFDIIENPYDVKSIIKASAQILNITAKDMAAKKVSPYFPVPIDFFMNLSLANCNIYAIADDDYKKIANLGSSLGDKISTLKDQGVNTLYVPSLERLQFINQSTTQIVSLLSDSNLSVSEKSKALNQGMDIIANLINHNPDASKEISEISKACIKSMQEISAENPKISKLLKMLKENQSGYIYQHSILTHYISSHILSGMTWGTPEQKDKLGFVLFYHDIYLIPLFNKYPHLQHEDEIMFDNRIDENDKEAALIHARQSGELIRMMKAPPIGSDTICVQHHGSTKGEGFTDTPSENISPLAKVIIIAESFVQDYMSMVSEDKNMQFNLKATLKKLSTKFKKASYRKLIDALESLVI